MWISEEDFNRHLEHIARSSVLAVDTEGTLTHPYSETWGLSYSTQRISEYFPYHHNLGENLTLEQQTKLSKVISDHPCLIFQHAKHDLRALRNLNIDRRGKKFYCTMLMDHMCNENELSYDLDSIGRRHVGYTKKKSPVMDSIIDGFGWEYVPSHMMQEYAAHDAFMTEDCFDSIYIDFIGQGFDGEYWDWMQDFTWVMADIEDVGMIINESFCEQKLEEGQKIMAEISNNLGFNPGSSTQLGKFLLEDLGLKPSGRKTDKGKHSFDAKAMEYYDEILKITNDDRARQILTYKGWSKATGSSYKPYLEKRSSDGRFRANYKMHGTKSGRMSCGYFQQIPRESKKPWNGEMKQAFTVDPGRIRWEADYKQLEFRLSAAYAKEKKLIQVFNDPNRDIFNEMAADLNMQRQAVKTLNYLLSFTGGPSKVAETFGVSEGTGLDIYNDYFRKYPGLRNISKFAEKKAREKGYVQNWAGRRRHFKFIDSESHKAFNSLIQGGAFEIVKRAMVRIYREGLINDECRMDIQVHDSVGFDIEEGKEDIYLPEIKRIMEDVDKDFDVKFYIDLHRWGTKDEWISNG